MLALVIYEARVMQLTEDLLIGIGVEHGSVKAEFTISKRLGHVCL